MSMRGGATVRCAEEEKGPSALVVVNEENAMTAASVLGGLAGLWLGGAIVGVGAFIVTSYITRVQKDSDVAAALTGVSTTALEAINSVANLNSKYEVTGKVGGAFSSALEEAKTKPEQKEIANAVSNALKSASDVVADVDVKETLGGLTTEASKLAGSATDTATSKASELNEKYKVTDQIQATVSDATKELQSKVDDAAKK